MRDFVIMENILDFSHTKAGEYLKKFACPFQAVQGIKEFILSLIPTLGDDYVRISDGVWAHKTAKIAPTAYIGAPCVIGAGTEVRHCAYVRGSALIGDNCVVGNSTELKNVILFDGVQAPHYNYVGDSILGYRAHMGAGSITSNVKSDKTHVCVTVAGERVDTGLKKLGAILGDFAEIGCNSVLNPGTIIGKNSTVYPLSGVRGTVDSDSIYKGNGVIVKKRP